MSVQGATDTNTAENRIALNDEAAAMAMEIDQVVKTSTFNGMHLLDGTYSSKQFQIGSDANNVMNVSIPSVTAKSLGLSIYDMSFKSNNILGSNGLDYGDLTIEISSPSKFGNSIPTNLPYTYVNNNGVHDFDESAFQLAHTINSPNYDEYKATARPTVSTGNAIIIPASNPPIIDLGVNGKLVAPIQVDGGKVFYYWDRSGNGTSSDAGSLNTGDWTQHNTLDAIFNKDVNGVVNTTVQNVDGNYGTTDTYRFGSLFDTSGNEIQLALPTIGGMTSPPFGSRGINDIQIPTYVGSVTGTGGNIGSDGSNAVNSTYNDLLAVWDAYNGTQNNGSWLAYGAQTGLPDSGGTPPGWRDHYYWSATPSASGHARLSMAGANVDDEADTTFDYVALEVTNPSSSIGDIANDDIEINGVNIGAIGSASSASQRSDQMIAAINAQTAHTGVTATRDLATGGEILTAADGRNIVISTLSSSAINSNQIGISLSGTASGSRSVTTLKSAVDLTVRIPDFVAYDTTITITATANGTNASGISSGVYSAFNKPTFNLGTSEGCQAAIGMVDKAIQSVSIARASIGASESGLISIVSNLDNSIMNLTDSRSRILDTDYATTTTELSRSQIISQASTAMLAQANLSAKDVLTLLK